MSLHMNQFLWYPPKDRTKELDKIVDGNKSNTNLPDDKEAFLKSVSGWIRKLATVGQYTAAHLSDWIWVASQYRIGEERNPKAYTIARAYLLTLKKLLDNPSGKLGTFLADFHWVTDSAVSQLTDLVGEKTGRSYLLESELADIDAKIAELSKNKVPLSPEERTALEGYNNLFVDIESDTYYPGISRMLQSLVAESETDSRLNNYTTACIRYVLEPEDIIPDTLGYVGLVDDLYVIDKACRLLSKQKTWRPLLHCFNNEWPFLTNLTFQDAKQAIRLPNFLRFVGGTALNGITQSGSKNCIIVPEVGPCGLLTVFLGAILSLQHQISQSLSAHKFEIGEDLLLKDSTTTLRVRYGGVLTHGSDTFHTIEFKKKARITVDDQTLAFASRPAQPHKTLSNPKEFETWRKACTPPLLCNIVGRDFDRKQLAPEILFLTQKNRLDYYIRALRPMNAPIPEIVGISYVTSSGNEESFSGDDRSGSLVLACSDYFTAKEVLDSDPKTIRHIISDTPESLQKLSEEFSHTDFPSPMTLTAICGAYENEKIKEFTRNGYALWGIKNDDISVVSDFHTRIPSQGVIKRYQARQSFQKNNRRYTHLVPCAQVEALFTAMQSIRENAGDGADPYQEIVAFSAMRFLRNFSKFTLDFDEEEQGKLYGQLCSLQNACGAIAAFNQNARELLDVVNKIEKEWPLPNPKTVALKKILATRNETGPVMVLCKSAELVKKYSLNASCQFGNAPVKWLTFDQLRITAPVRQLIVPAWMDKKTMRELRGSGYAQRFDMLFYEYEMDWEKASQNATLVWQRRLASSMSTQWHTLEKKYGPIEKPSCVYSPSSEEESSILPEVDVGDEELKETVIQRIRDAAYATKPNGSETIKGQLITFEDSNSYIFLPPNGSVISLSNFFGNADEEPKETDHNAERLVSCPVAEVKAGDLLAFSTDSNRDLIDELADQLIRNHVETRRLADLWRTALITYLKEGGTVASLRVHLALNGLVRHPVTLRGWINGNGIIAPLQYKNAIRSIAQTTKHQELCENLKAVDKAIEKIYSARSEAANEFLKEISSKDLSFAEGKASINFRGHQINYELHRVLSIDPPQEIISQCLGRIMSISFKPTDTPQKNPKSYI